MRIAVLIFAAAGSLLAQSNAGSITTHALQVFGPSLIDGAGNTYSTSVAYSNQFVTTGAAQTQYGGGFCGASPAGAIPCTDAVIAKVDATGRPVYSTYLGGPTNDAGNAVAADAAGNVYVAGSTGGSFPTTANAAIPTSATSTTFAAKLSADGSKFIYSTYLPDTITNVYGIAVDAQGNAYIVGVTTTNHACAIKLSADGSSVVYTMVLAGSNKDAGAAVAVDAAGDAFVTGGTSSPDFPVSSGVVQSQLAGAQNAFLTKLDPSGNIVFSTYLGGSGTDSGSAIQVDASGNAYIVGATSSLDFPTTAGSFAPAPLVPAWAISPGGFTAKLSADGSSLAYSTYFFGVWALAVGTSGDTYLSGSAGGFLPVTQSAPQPCVAGNYGGGGSDFVAHLDGHGALVDETYFADDVTYPLGMAVAADGSVLVAARSGLSQIRFGGPEWSAPACMTMNVNNAATFGVAKISPGELVTFAGFGIGPENGVTAERGADGISTMLAGVQVLFDGKAAPVLYAQSRQVNAQAPFELNGQSTTSITVTYNGAVFGPMTVPVVFAYPGFFRLQPNVSAQAYALNQDGTLNSVTNPAPRGSVVAYWGTGFGSTSPGCATGGLNAPGPVNLVPDLSVIMELGGPVQYAGGAPGLACGITQVNMQVPLDSTPGALRVYPQVWMSGTTFEDPMIPSIIYIK
jgi:uncharacterized protein (TIGR03437 family)